MDLSYGPEYEAFRAGLRAFLAAHRERAPKAGFGEMLLVDPARAAWEEAGIAADESLVKLGSARSLWGEMATSELMRLPEPPTAIFVASNAIMPGVLKTLRLHNLQLPEEMSLICFDDMDWFSYSIPSITAVTTNPMRFAEAVVDLIMKRIQTPKDLDEPPVLIQINFELVLRRSTVPPRRQPILHPARA